MQITTCIRAMTSGWMLLLIFTVPLVFSSLIRFIVFIFPKTRWSRFGEKSDSDSTALPQLPAPSAIARCILTLWVNGRNPTLETWNHNTLLCPRNTVHIISSTQTKQIKNMCGFGATDDECYFKKRIHVFSPVLVLTKPCWYYWINFLATLL